MGCACSTPLPRYDAPDALRGAGVVRNPAREVRRSRGYLVFPGGPAQHFVRLLHQLVTTSDFHAVSGQLVQLSTIACVLRDSLDLQAWDDALRCAVAKARARHPEAWTRDNAEAALIVSIRLRGSCLCTQPLPMCECVSEAAVEHFFHSADAQYRSRAYESPPTDVMSSPLHDRPQPGRGIHGDACPHCFFCGIALMSTQLRIDERFELPRSHGADAENVYGTLFEKGSHPSEWAHVYGWVFQAPVDTTALAALQLTPRPSTCTRTRVA